MQPQHAGLGLVLLVTLSLLPMLGSAFDLANCRAPEPEIPDIYTRCDKQVACQDYCKRNQLSLDWLCCEDGKGWVASHILNPMTFYLFWQDAVWTALVVLLFEVFEALVLTLTGQFLVFPTSPTELETWSGSLIGDGLLQGGLGLLLGLLLQYCFALPRLVSSPQLARLNSEGGGHGWRVGRVSLWLVHTTTFLVIAMAGDLDTERPGLLISLALQLLLIAVLYPWLFFADTPLTRRMLAGRKASPWAFWCWAVVVLAVDLSTAGWQWFANDWFQVWLTAAVLVTLLTVYAIAVAAQRRDGPMLVVWLAVYGLLLSLALAVAGRAFDVAGIFFASLPVLAVAIGACICRTQIAESPPPQSASRLLQRPQKQ